MEKYPSSSYIIRFPDCDMFGHLNNARYLDYFLNARQDHVKQAYQLDLNDFYSTGLGWAITNHNIFYVRPAVFNETVFIQSALLEVSEKEMTVEFLMMDEKQSHVKSLVWTKYVPINIKTGSREKHNDEFLHFARSVECTEIDVARGVAHRLSSIINSLKAKV
jgi:acyl-CoA thioester hydrolase